MHEEKIGLRAYNLVYWNILPELQHKKVANVSDLITTKIIAPIKSALGRVCNTHMHEYE